MTMKKSPDTLVMEWISGDRKAKLTDNGTAYVVRLHVPHKRVALMGEWPYTAETQREAKASAWAYASRIR